VTCSVRTGGASTCSRGLLPEHHVVGARVVPVDRGRRRVVGVGEPRFRAAFGAGGDAAHRPEAGQGKVPDPLPGGEVVHTEFTERVPLPPGEEHRSVQFRAVEDRIPAEDRVRVAGDQGLPVVRGGRGRVGHAQPSPRRVQVGEEVQPAVAAHMREGFSVHTGLDLGEARRFRGGHGEVRDPRVVAGRGARRSGERQPPAVAADRHPEVFGFVPPFPEDQRVLFRGGAHPVQVDPPVVLLFSFGDQFGGEAAHIVERVTARQPRDRGVGAAVDGAVDVLPGVDVHHPQPGLLVSVIGQLVGQQPSLPVHHPRVQGGGAFRVQFGGVDEDPFRS